MLKYNACIAKIEFLDVKNQLKRIKLRDIKKASQSGGL